jgi:hypothetical protein
MRVVRRIGCAACAVAALSAAPVQASTAPLDSGIVARVLYGPTCPVQRPGISCVRPWQAWLTVRRLPSETVATRGRSSKTGWLRLGLRPGRYLVQPRNPPHDTTPYPRAPTQAVTVRAHQFTHITVRFDSGIR